jgi:hypothetical protein
MGSPKTERFETTATNPSPTAPTVPNPKVTVVMSAPADSFPLCVNLPPLARSLVTHEDQSIRVYFFLISLILMVSSPTKIPCLMWVVVVGSL